LMQKAKLAITDIGTLAHDAPLAGREEQFMSNLAERIPVVGKGVRASDRAYTGFLNKSRADMFDLLVHQAAAAGHDITDQHVVESIARFVNSASGRGDLGAFQKHAVTLNTLFFSPRLMFSRFNFLNPNYYVKLDPFARMEALKAARNLVATMSFVLYMAKLGGATVNMDPRNSDFAKIRVGNTRIDIAAGFQQPVRLIAQLFSGKVISSTTGNTLTLGPQGPGKLSRWDIIQRFVEGKLGPVPSLIESSLKGTDSMGQKLTYNSVVQRMVPLLFQDVQQMYSQYGVRGAAAAAGVDLFGVGLQNYGPAATPTYPADTGATTPPAAAQKGFTSVSKLGGAGFAKTKQAPFTTLSDVKKK
jgi:hypothetical protein